MEFKNRVVFTRKPRELKDVYSEVILSAKEYESLPKFDYKEIQNQNKNLMNDFKIKVPSIFILIIKEKNYLVDTGGYNYPRYMSKIVKVLG